MEPELEVQMRGLLKSVEDVRDRMVGHIEAADTTDDRKRANEWAAVAGLADGILQRGVHVLRYFLKEFPADWNCEGCGTSVGHPVTQDPKGGRWHPLCLQLFRCHTADGQVEDEAFEFLRRRMAREAVRTPDGVA